MIRRIKVYFITLLLFCMLVVQANIVHAVEKEKAYTELASAYDEYFAEAMNRLHIPGVALAVVADGDPVILNGYGLACVDPEIPVDVNATLFRIGSVTKLITATAVMQCVEKGLLDLDEDVNNYLVEWQVPHTYPQSITLRHLLTHTAGFDDRFLELGVRNPAELEALGVYLQRRLPRRIAPPGEAFNYSNFGITLAAHLVESVTGQSYMNYVEEHLFRPLEMTPDGFAQPLDDRKKEHLAYTYQWTGNNYVASQWRDAASQVYPAGAYATTAPDMAKFMMMHLQYGRYKNKQILQESTARVMQQPHYAAHPGLQQQQAFAFHLRKYKGQQLVWHTGRVDMFSAQLVLVPELNLGLFVVSNADSGGEMRNDVVDILAEHMFPAYKPQERDDIVSMPDHKLQPLCGAYRQVRHVRDSFTKLGFLGREIYFSQDNEGGLYETGVFNTSEAIHWKATKNKQPVLFTSIDDGKPLNLVFHQGADGARYASMDRKNFTVLTCYERLNWYEQTRIQLLVAGICLLLFISSISLHIWERFSGYRKRIVMDTEWGHLAGHLSFLTSFLLVLFVVGLAVVLLLTDMYLFAFGIPWRIKMLLALPWLAAFVAVFSGVVLVKAFLAAPRQNRLRHGYSILILLASIIFLLQLHYWRLF